jgi:predicted  nucleic acid-binding Zn ribbon protein
MYIQEISIEINTKEDKYKIIEEFRMLLSAYRNSGQTQGKIESQYIDKNRIVCLPYTLEKHALSRKFNNYYVNNRIK